MQKKNVLAQAISLVPEFEEIHENFIQKLTLKGLSKKTIECYSRIAAQTTLFYKCNPLLLNEKLLDKYLFHLKTTRQGETAFKQTIYGLLSLYELSGKKTLKTKLPSIPQKEKLPLVLSQEECRKLIETPTEFRDRFLIALMYSSGMRISEISRLKIADIDTQRMFIRVVQSKGNKDRYVPLSKIIAYKIPKYLKYYSPKEFFFNSCKGKPFSVRGIQRVLKQAVKDSGILKNASSHTLRHSYATHLLENGVNLLTIKNVLGHENILTTMIYLHVVQPIASSFKNPFDLLYFKEK